MRFDDCFAKLMHHEGGLSKDKHDPGGATRYGISQKQYPRLNIDALTLLEAKEIYRKDYWNEIIADSLPKTIRYIVFDTAVNLGVDRAVRILQEIVGATVDGIVGAETIRESRGPHLNLVLKKYATERILYYAKLKHFNRYGRGWTRRVIDVVATSLR